MNVYFEELETEELDREKIFAETDATTLNKWLADQRMIGDELRALIGAYRGTGINPSLGVVKKLGFTNIAVSWINKRLGDIGGEAELEGKDRVYQRLRRQLTEQSAANEKKNKQLKELRARVAELEAALEMKQAA